MLEIWVFQPHSLFGKKVEVAETGGVGGEQGKEGYGGGGESTDEAP
jgi:hypothetical protein